MWRIAAALALLGASLQAPAQSWPNKPVRLIVSQAAGGAPDIVARLVSDKLSRAWGQQVIVENRPGSGNIVGAQAAARAAPDGYTLFFATAASLVTNPYTFKTLPYDPVKDFVPIGMVGKAPFLVLVHPGVPAKTIGELIAAEKAQPGKLTYATDGPRNFSGMVASWLNKLGGINILQVPYATMPQGVQDTVAGRTQLAILAIPVAAPQIKRGALRPLAFTTASRVPGYPDIPTVAESFPGFDFVGWFGIVAPTGTPHEVIQRANRDLDAVMKDPEVVQRLLNMGIFTDGADTPERFGAFIRTELANWGKLITEIGLPPE
jgi:tripartite-type tricarboxylate transporter receptor subunit TctC